jgi:hypothetical protein
MSGPTAIRDLLGKYFWPIRVESWAKIGSMKMAMWFTQMHCKGLVELVHSRALSLLDGTWNCMARWESPV